MGTIRLVDPQGTTHDVPEDAAGPALDAGWRPETAVDAAARASERAREADYGGVSGTAKAALAGAARMATLGGSDLALRALGGEDTAIDLQGLRDVNPGATFAGEIAGAFVPFGPAAAAARLGHGVQGALAGAEAGAAARIGASAAGGAVAGAAFGAGAGVSDLALSSDPLTIDRIASTIGSHALLGAVGGSVLSGGGTAAAEALGAAKGKLDAALARRAARKATTPTEAIDTGDLGLIDKGILDHAEKTEMARLREAQAPERQKVVEEIGKYRQADRDADEIRSIAKVSDDRNVREASAAMTRSGLGLRKLLDNKIKFAENPGVALDHLRVQRQALDTISAWAKAEEAAWQADVEAIPQRVRESILAGDVPGEIGPFTSAGLDLAVERELKLLSKMQWNGAVKNGFKRPSIVSSSDLLQSAIERNTQLQQQLERISAPPTSPRLDKIAEARAALNAPKAPSLSDAVAAAAPLAGPIGVAAAGAGRALGKLRGLADAVAVSSGKAVSQFLGATSKVAARAPVLATKVLSGVSYAWPTAANGNSLPALFRARTDEIKSQVHVAADGTYQMRPEARAKMAARLDGIRPADPILADRLETTFARRIAYLASIIPRLPDFGTARVGPEHRQVSDLEMRSWARSVYATEHPHEVIGLFAHGHMVPEYAAALRAVHPELVADLVTQVTSRLGELRQRLPYQRRLALSMLTGVAVDPAMTPMVLNEIQSLYATEPGTAGGTMAPRAEPQFGSVRASPPTRAEQRQGARA